MKKLVVDIGSGVTKYINDSGRGLINSSVGLYREDAFSLEGRQTVVIEFDGNKWVFDKDAENTIRPQDRVNTCSAEWAMSDGHLALLYAVIHMSYPTDDIKSMALGTGLPYKYYNQYKDRLKARLAKDHRFSVNGVEHKVRLTEDKVFVVPQIMGVYFSAAAENPSLLNKRVGVFDLGTFTFAHAIIDHLQLKTYDSDGDSVGVSNVVERLIDELHKRYRISIGDDEAKKFIRQRKFHENGSKQDVDLGELIDDICSDVLKDTMKSIAKKWGNARNFPIIVGGGGGEVFMPVIRRFYYAHAIEATQQFPLIWSVVNGFNKYLEAKIGKTKDAA